MPADARLEEPAVIADNVTLVAATLKLAWFITLTDPTVALAFTVAPPTEEMEAGLTLTAATPDESVSKLAGETDAFVKASMSKLTSVLGIGTPLASSNFARTS
ncbi:MAG: hypothetical protein A3F78_17935 [Burkholderiales bacterium RIFCSPLOWO2_12_FULL_61_40]|nr:MAG: hypothetical protein A3F78_17935 [Burkholderiales bacterium RIFCSPLOWO2_12_FULL_61_40]